MVKVKAIIEGDSTHGYSVYMDDETLGYSVNGQGDTVAGAVVDFRAVYAEMIAYLKEEGRPCTEVEFEFVHSYEENMKQTLSDILLDISWARLSVKYFGKSRSWLHQKLDGKNSNGGVGGFSEAEKAELRLALKDLSARINAAADRIE